jgi:hypothetical protein
MRPHMLLTPCQKRPVRCSRLGLSAWAKPVPSADRLALMLRSCAWHGERFFAGAELCQGGA